MRLRVCARVGSSAAACADGCAGCATADCSVQSYYCKRSPCNRLSVQRGDDDHGPEYRRQCRTHRVIASLPTQVRLRTASSGHAISNLCRRCWVSCARAWASVRERAGVSVSTRARASAGAHLDHRAHGVRDENPARLQHDARPVDLRRQHAAQVAQRLPQVHQRPGAAGDCARLREPRHVSTAARAARAARCVRCACRHMKCGEERDTCAP